MLGQAALRRGRVLALVGDDVKDPPEEGEWQWAVLLLAVLALMALTLAAAMWLDIRKIPPNTIPPATLAPLSD